LMHLMSKPGTKQRRQEWVPADIQLEASCDTAFLVGCAPYFDVIFKDIGVKTTDGSVGAMRLLNLAGIPYRLLGNERCCGHDLLLSGDQEGFADLAKANVEEFAGQGIRKLIVSCPECYYTLKVDYARHVNGWDMEVVHLMELPDVLKIAEDRVAGRELGKATYHDSCRLGRHFQNYDAPRKLLRSAAGVGIVEMESNMDNSLCCGASPWMFCGSVNRQVQDERLRQARSTGAPHLLTACPKCQIHLRCAQVAGSRDGDSIDIVDIYHFVSQRLLTKENV
jgi:heterodisulfide reductase subunit D